jgi:hypothetical protein
VKIDIYRNVILPVVSYGCGFWSLTLREEHRLRVCKNGVVRKVFGPKKDEVTTGEWRVHNEELYGMYFSPDFIWVIKSRRMQYVWGRGEVHFCGET